MQVLYTLIHDSQKHNINSLSDKLQYNQSLLKAVIKQSLNLKFLEFYIGNTRIEPSNTDPFLNLNSNDIITVITKADIVDKESHDRFFSMIYNYLDSQKKNSDFKRFIITNELNLSMNNHELHDASLLFIQDLLSKSKTTKCFCFLYNVEFFPIAIYNDRSKNRDYLVSLSPIKDQNTWSLCFYPTDVSKVISNNIKDSILLSEMYSSDILGTAIQKAKKIWGPQEILLTENPILISALIYDISCINKIRHDIYGKKANLYQNQDNTFTLEIEILGYESFKSWVLSYGSSIEIIKPHQLRQDLCNIYKEVLNNC